jgi:DNA-binding transcriptional LysR family regulator
MDTEQVRTFVAVAAHGSFLEAATRIHVTQSTVSARIQALEGFLGARLFTRNRSGAVLTPAGRRFLRHAKSLLLTLEQAKHDVGLPSRFRASIRIGARIALWDGFLPKWIRRMRERTPDVSIRTEIGFEEDLMRRIVEGTMDLALMYTPQYGMGVQVEHLFDETVILLSSDPDYRRPDDSYVYVDWGPAFYAQHTAAYPGLEGPALRANIGWLGLQLILEGGGACFVPKRVAAPYLEQQRLYCPPDSPVFRLPAYVVYPTSAESFLLEPALELLRELAAEDA